MNFNSYLFYVAITKEHPNQKKLKNNGKHNTFKKR